MEIRPASPGNLVELMHIYSSAREHMMQVGNANQWIDGYPSQEVISLDIKNNNHFICIEDSQILGCFTFIIGKDSTYSVIEKGTWLNSKPYAVIHRLAILEHGKGIGSFCIEWCFSRHQNIKVDTHQDNISMQKLLVKNEFQRCGIIYNARGDARVAFQSTGRKTDYSAP